MSHSDLKNEDNSKNDDSSKNEEDNKKKTTCKMKTPLKKEDNPKHKDDPKDGEEDDIFCLAQQPSAMVNVAMRHFLLIFPIFSIQNKSHNNLTFFPKCSHKSKCKCFCPTSHRSRQA